ncbi:hypothetical protein [Neobacillus kokaensis]|uniref:Uncharacterized protein n=1 Tax=Neobacillus kokaensis TaxID=2759023 RepID=A0ABQ3MZB8_9BACI|nr:hypothetical protein [Neobacillus kokaensis]GHH96603.1 hypothetical protein AM1BK_01460 [Neobacillus kokaensis]
MNEKQRLEGQQVNTANSSDKKSAKDGLVTSFPFSPCYAWLQATFRKV